ncbi:MAG: acyl-CoA dehydrogenase [Acidiferrobacterales bacterium]
MTVVWVLGIIVAVAALAYHRAPLWLWTTSAVLALGFAFATNDVAIGAQIFWGTVFVLVAAPLNILPLRRLLLSRTLFKFFARALPEMSDTEREALEAGTVWWDADLFSGKPDFKKLLDIPKPQLTEEEQAFLDGPVNELCELIDDWKITNELFDLSPEVWQYLKDKGFFGMIIPKEYGGLEFSALAHSAVVGKIASRSITTAVTMMVPNSLGPAELLLNYGTDKQRDQYLRGLAKGKEIPCFALTAPDAGSDAGAMPDNGVICRGEFGGNKDVLGIRLNFNKRYITLAPVATVMGLAFKLYDPDHLIGETEDYGITVALIPTGTAGIDIGRRHQPLNIPFQNGPILGKDVFIPIDWIIGGQERVGQGWRMLMESLAAGRSISLPALSAGAGKLMSRTVGAYSRIRRQFNLPIGKFEGVEEALARIAGYTYMMDAARTLTLTAVDLGEKPSVISAIAKYELTEHMRKVVDDTMDVRGGSAICMGPRNITGRVYQAVPVSITVEGANILTRTLIIFGQGAVRCHPYVFAEMESVRNPDTRAGLTQFDRAIFGHVGFALSNAVRAFWLAVTGARFTYVPVSGLPRRYAQHIVRLSSAFALLSDMAMLTLGGALKRKEKISGRLADALSHLYLASALIKRFNDDGQPEADRVMFQWAGRYCLNQVEEALDGMIQNFPLRPVAWLMRLIALPTGRYIGVANDELGHKVASLLLQPSEARDRLTSGMFVSRNVDGPIHMLEDALPKVIAAEPIEHTLRRAVKKGEVVGRDSDAQLLDAVSKAIISESEAELVRVASAARDRVIQVDDFSPEELGVKSREGESRTAVAS